jgi:phenylpropionate dioxygenase-like ring-hydroxylating dioxygenase large terminal subunit
MRYAPIVREKQTTALPKYNELESGLRNYWHPVMLSRQLRRKYRPIQLFGQTVLLIRDQGKVFALDDRCPHRGTPLRFGKRDFPGTITCIYHGWCFDLKNGQLRAALTDGPNSAIVGKIGVRSYPTEERNGLIWIYMGTGTPPPIEEDLPEEFLDPQSVFAIRISEQDGNWRFAVENHFDDSHAQYLHRDSLFSLFSHGTSYKTGVRIARDGKWLTRKAESVHYEADYPGLGHWPRRITLWRKKYSIKISLAMPGVGRVIRKPFTGFKFHVPVNDDRFLFVQVLTKRATGLSALIFHARYWLHRRWLYHVLFNNDDVLMTKYSHSGPEYLFAPDVSITAWRRMCISEARPDPVAAE